MDLDMYRISGYVDIRPVPSSRGLIHGGSRIEPACKSAAGILHLLDESPRRQGPSPVQMSAADSEWLSVCEPYIGGDYGTFSGRSHDRDWDFCGILDRRPFLRP